MIKILTCFLLGCVVLTLGARLQRLVNGKKVDSEVHQKYYRFVVKVYVGDKYSNRLCTGTLVRDNLVLLASHCFCGYKYKMYIRVIADIESKAGDDTGDERFGVRVPNSRLKKVICPHGRTILPPTGNDVALIQLHRPYYDIEPVKVWCGDVPKNLEVTMIGYGLDKHGQGGTLRFANATTAGCPSNWPNDPICVGHHKGLPEITSGDSGGPLLTKYKKRGSEKFYQVGVSRSTRPSRIRVNGFLKFNLYENIANHCKWIKSAHVKESAGYRSSAEMMVLMIQPFVVFIVLYF